MDQNQVKQPKTVQTVTITLFEDGGITIAHIPADYDVAMDMMLRAIRNVSNMFVPVESYIGSIRL